MSKQYQVGVAATGMVLPKTCYSNDDMIAEINQATVGRDDIPELNSAWIEENIWIKKFILKIELTFFKTFESFIIIFYFFFNKCFKRPIK